MTSMTFLSLVIMLLAGAAGGYAGYRANWVPAKPGEPDHDQRDLVTDIVIGVVAALCIPVLLWFTGSKLLGTLLTTPAPADWLVFAGLCLLAAYSSRTFLQTMSGQLLKKLDNKVSEVEKKVSSVDDKVSGVNGKVDALHASVTRYTDLAMAPPPSSKS